MDKKSEALYDEERWEPTCYKSRKWYMWESALSDRTCKPCKERHGKVISRTAPQEERPPAHPNCRCRLVMLLTVLIGTMTRVLEHGVEVYYARHGALPAYYLTKKRAELLGWIQKRGNLGQVLPGAMIGGDIYRNKDGRLPHVPGRVWYEADFDYDTGYRNDYRLLYSNDGLMFVTYDHYETFCAVGYGVKVEEAGMTNLQKLELKLEEVLSW